MSQPVIKKVDIKDMLSKLITDADTSAQLKSLTLNEIANLIYNTNKKPETIDASTQTDLQESTTPKPTSVNSSSTNENSSTNAEFEEKYQALNKELDELRNDICDTEKINEIQTYLLTESAEDTDNGNSSTDSDDKSSNNEKATQHEKVSTKNKPQIDNVLKKIFHLYREIINTPIETLANISKIKKIKKHKTTIKAQTHYTDHTRSGYIPHQSASTAWWVKGLRPQRELEAYITSQQAIHDLHKTIMDRFDIFDRGAIQEKMAKLMKKLGCTVRLYYCLVTIAWVKLREDACAAYSSPQLMKMVKTLRGAAEELGDNIMLKLTNDDTRYADYNDQLYHLSPLLMSLSLLMLPYAIYTETDGDGNKSTSILTDINMCQSDNNDVNKKGYNFNELYPNANYLIPKWDQVWTLKDIDNDEHSSITNLFKRVREKNLDLKNAFDDYLDEEKKALVKEKEALAKEEEVRKYGSININFPRL